MRNVMDRWSALSIRLPAGDQTVAQPLADGASVDRLTVRSPDGEPAEARGDAVLSETRDTTLSLNAPAAVPMTLNPAGLGQSLSFACDLLPVDEDPWEERPLPRYAVGPVEDVEHYL